MISAPQKNSFRLFWQLWGRNFWPPKNRLRIDSWAPLALHSNGGATFLSQPIRWRATPGKGGTGDSASFSGVYIPKIQTNIWNLLLPGKPIYQVTIDPGSKYIGNWKMRVYILQCISMISMSCAVSSPEPFGMFCLLQNNWINNQHIINSKPRLDVCSSIFITTFPKAQRLSCYLSGDFHADFGGPTTWAFRLLHRGCRPPHRDTACSCYLNPRLWIGGPWALGSLIIKYHPGWAPSWMMRKLATATHYVMA